MDEHIEEMNLYVDVEGRISRELRALGFDDSSELEVETLSRFDNLNYGGTSAVAHAIERCGLTADSRVLEVGSGAGGPARFLAKTTGCHVTALELQSSLHDYARQLTVRTGLAEQVEHVCDDFLNPASVDGSFDAVVSWLAFLHIPDRSRLFQRCFDCLKPGGFLYTEDYAAIRELSREESRDLESHVFCSYVPGIDQYRREVETAGFESVTIEDMSSNWTEFVDARLDAFLARKDEFIRLHGQKCFDGMLEFYSTVTRLFRGGNLGGIRLSARKPDTLER